MIHSCGWQMLTQHVNSTDLDLIEFYVCGFAVSAPSPLGRTWRLPGIKVVVKYFSLRGKRNRIKPWHFNLVLNPKDG